MPVVVKQGSGLIVLTIGERRTLLEGLQVAWPRVSLDVPRRVVEQAAAASPKSWLPMVDWEVAADQGIGTGGLCFPVSRRRFAGCCDTSG